MPMTVHFHPEIVFDQDFHYIANEFVNKIMRHNLQSIRYAKDFVIMTCKPEPKSFKGCAVASSYIVQNQRSGPVG